MGKFKHIWYTDEGYSINLKLSQFDDGSKYKESHPDDVDFVENSDGSICGHVPLKWLKISPPRKVELTDEQKAERSERMRKLAASRKGASS